MSNLNKVFLLGRLTQDPDVRQTPRGNQIVTLTLAINRDTKDEHGNRRQETGFIETTCLGRIGELAAQYLHKGRECLIEGRLRQQTWQDKQTGKQRSKIDILAESLQFIGGVGNKQSQQGQQRGSMPNNGASIPNNSSNKQQAPLYMPDDDVPF